MTHLNTRSSYKYYSIESKNPIDISTYIKIVNGFMKFLMAKLFLKGEILLPERMGVLKIIGKKVKVKIEGDKILGLAPDWVGTKELWSRDEKSKKEKKLVYHFNEDTNGIRYKFLWSKSKMVVPNKTLYNLKLTRTNKRFLSSLIKEGKEYLIK